jgi:hypothetical protein
MVGACSPGVVRLDVYNAAATAQMASLGRNVSGTDGSAPAAAGGEGLKERELSCRLDSIQSPCV